MTQVIHRRMIILLKGPGFAADAGFAGIAKQTKDQKKENVPGIYPGPENMK